LDEIERLEREYERLEEKLSDVRDDFYRLQRRRDDLIDKRDREDDPRIRADFQKQIDLLGETIAQNDDFQLEINAAMDEAASRLRQEQEFSRKREIDPEKGFDTDEWERERALRIERKKKPKL
jgi:predicted nuclease with TOPRIM domain